MPVTLRGQSFKASGINIVIFKPDSCLKDFYALNVMMYTIRLEYFIDRGKLKKIIKAQLYHALLANSIRMFHWPCLTVWDHLILKYKNTKCFEKCSWNLSGPMENFYNKKQILLFVYLSFTVISYGFPGL